MQELQSIRISQCAKSASDLVLLLRGSRNKVIIVRRVASRSRK